MKNELRVIENSLVPVYQTDTGEKVVYGSELHETLEVQTPYRLWSERRLHECDAEENLDFQGVQICTPGNPTPRKDHIILLDTAKEMAMLERNEKGKELRRYFIEVEKRYKSVAELGLKIGSDFIPMTPDFLIGVLTKYKEEQEERGRLVQKAVAVEVGIEGSKEEGALAEMPAAPFLNMERGDFMGVITAQDVVNSLFGPDEKVCLSVFEDKKEGLFPGTKLDIPCGRFSEVEETLHNHNQLDRGIFYTVNYGGQTDSEIT
ncbi:MAG: antA/AntB antirepressor family protein, partial [Blautia sp.]|nr:antA/AntB antirepressor family protein [Blautia sp.]